MRQIKKTKTSKSFSFRTFLRHVWVSFLIVMICAFIGINVWAYYTGFWAKKWDGLTQSVHNGLVDAGFTLNEVLITGRNRTSMGDICKIFNIPHESDNCLTIQKDTLITTLDIQGIQEKFRNLPWVKDVTVRRQLPDILHIDLTERKPIALWQKNNMYYPLDEQGQVVKENCPECIEYLLLIVGNNAPKQAPDLIKNLNKHEYIYNRLMSAKWVDNRRWNLYIDDIDKGKIVLLPDSDLDESLTRLEKLQNEKGVLDKQIEQLDLRFDDRVIIKANGKEAITSAKKEGK